MILIDNNYIEVVKILQDRMAQYYLDALVLSEEVINNGKRNNYTDAQTYYKTEVICREQEEK